MKGAVPYWLAGSIPVGSKKERLSRYTPFGLWGDPIETVAQNFNPLGESVLNNLAGKDWKGKDLPPNVKNNPYAKLGMALATFIEGTVPITGIAAQAIQKKQTPVKGFVDYENPFKPVSPPKSKTSNPFDRSSGKRKNPFDTKSSSSKNPFD